MQWDDTTNAGFSSKTPWLKVNPNYLEVNAALAERDPDSVLAYYRELITLRHKEPAVANGDFQMLLPDDEQIYAFTRRLDDVELLVLANLSGAPADPGPLPDWADAQVLLINMAPTPPGPLQPWEARCCAARSTDRRQTG